MTIYTEGAAIIRHATSGEEYVIEADELDWDVVGSDERSMGPQTHYAAEVEHPELGQLVWNLWEYPAGAENLRRVDSGEHLLVQDFSYGIASERDEPTDDSQEDFDAHVEEIVEWFHSRYEEPVHRTSYAGSEGGYLWDHGGPFDARDEIENNFVGEASEFVIDAAVKQVEADGTIEWAAKDWHGEPYEDIEEDEGIYPIDRPLPDLSSLEDGSDALTDDEAVPPQGPGLAFEFGDSGQIELRWQGALGPAEASSLAELRRSLAETVSDLAQALAGTNAFPHIARLAERYADAVSSEPVSIDRIYATGVRLENARQALQVQIDSEDFPPLADVAAEALDSVLAIHGPFLLSTDRGRQLVEQAREYARSEFEADAYRAASLDLAEAARATPGLVSREAGDALVEVAEEVGMGPHHERSAQVAHSGIRNFLITVAKPIALFVAATLTGQAVLASEPGALAVGGLTGGINACWNFLNAYTPTLREFIAASGGADLGWLRSLLNRIQAVRTAPGI